MFLPTSNRLAGFLEISALSIHLAPSGGPQYKAGYLWIAAYGSKGTGFGRKSAGRLQKRKQKWCAIRESYLVAVEEPGELAVWDVFLLDAHFEIERPKRYYRQVLDFSGDSSASRSVDNNHAERGSWFDSIRSCVSDIFHPRHDAPHASPSSVPGVEHENHVRSDTDADSLDPESRPPTPALDPSTNTNPLNEDGTQTPRHREDVAQKKKKRGGSGEVSKHTFYIKNSQMQLKLHARSEVRRTCCTCANRNGDLRMGR